MSSEASNFAPIASVNFVLKRHVMATFRPERASLFHEIGR